MSFMQRISAWYFGESEIQRQEFASTPLIDAIEADQNGTLLPQVTRDEAFSVLPVMLARNLICNSISALPLKTYNSKWKPMDNPLFRQIDSTRTNGAVLADTVEDLLMYKYAYWRILSRGSDGYPTEAEHIHFLRVSEDVKDGRSVIRIDGKLQDWADIRKFESPNPGLLKHGGRVIKRSLDLDLTAARYARNPMPLNYFRPMDGVDPLDDNGIRGFLQKWKRWLRNETTGYVPAGMDYVTVDQPTPAELQLIESQKQVALSIANMTGLDPEKLGVSTTSRTYANIVDRRQDEINEVYKPYMNAITERLSFQDVTKRGHVVVFDLSEFLKANPKERAEVQLMYHSAGLLTDDEIRNDEQRPALPPRKQPIEPETLKEVTDGDA